MSRITINTNAVYVQLLLNKHFYRMFTLAKLIGGLNTNASLVFYNAIHIAIQQEL